MLHPLDVPPYQLPSEFRQTAVETICGVYHVNKDRHDPDAGDDTATFGSHSYRNVHNALEAHFEGSQVVRTHREHNAVILEVVTDRGSVWVRTNKFGRTVHDDPRAWVCDDHPARLQHAGRNGPGDQLSFFDGDDIDIPRGLFLLHAGNEIDGAAAVYLGAPKILDGRHCGWHFLIQLWKAESSVAERIAAGDSADFLHQPKPEVPVRMRQIDLASLSATAEKRDR